MPAKRPALPDRPTLLAVHQPRALIGGSILACLMVAELLASLVIRGSL